MKVAIALALLGLLILFGCTNNPQNTPNMTNPTGEYNDFAYQDFSFKYDKALTLSRDVNAFGLGAIAYLSDPSMKNSVLVKELYSSEEINIDDYCNKEGVAGEFNYVEKSTLLGLPACNYDFVVDVGSISGVSGYKMRMIWTTIFNYKVAYYVQYSYLYNETQNSSEVEALVELGKKSYLNPLLESFKIEPSKNQLKVFNQDGIMFMYSPELQEHWGGVLGYKETLLNLITPFTQASISIQKYPTQGVVSSDELCEDLNQGLVVNSFKRVLMSRLPACEIDYNSQLGNTRLHCIEYVTSKSNYLYVVNYCGNLRDCNVGLDLNIAGTLIKDCELAEIGNEVSFETDTNYYLKTIVDSFTITD